ncbi:MAG TPA: carbohydrate kinase family protein [Patescibacteria group bacterium]|nr:carbohydrate kinase family protein [Patescibacteria group bacterium]
MFDIISIGDAMQDFFIDLQEASVLTSKGEMKLNLCVSFADKVPAKSIDAQVAGNAANVAVGSSRLGLKTALYSVIGDDGAGTAIKEKMQAEKVSTKYLITDKGKKNNYSFVLNHKNERTIIIYHEPRKYRMPKLEHSEWIYLTSLGNTSQRNKSFLDLHRDVIKHVKRHRVKLAFNPGTYQIRMHPKLLGDVIATSEVVFMNVEEARYILGAKKDAVIKSLLYKLFQRGPKKVVITDGPNGSYAYSGDAYYKIGIFPSPLLERTGAGDSFATAFVAALFYNKDTADALCWGTINSASVVTKIGPMAGLLTESTILRTLKKHPKFVSEKF